MILSVLCWKRYNVCMANRDCRKCGNIGSVTSLRGPATCGECQGLPRKHYATWYEAHGEEARRYKRDNMRRYRQENPGRYAEQSRQAKQRQRDRLFEMYGETCNLCGFDDKRALTLDHILYNGADERRSMTQGGIYRRALEEYRPLEYRTLCMNCQFITRAEFLRKVTNA